MGDRVHVPGFGTGVVREVRNGGQCLVEIKGRAMVVRAAQLLPAEARTPASRASVDAASIGEPRPVSAPTPTLDLHGHTVETALEALEVFLSDALLAGAEEARVIHGRSGGRIKAAIHSRLRALPSVKAFGIDPRNAGVTRVVF